MSIKMKSGYEYKNTKKVQNNSLANKVKTDFYEFPCPYWSDRMKLEFLQRRIIVACIIYYMLNESVINDDDYEQISHQYLRMAKTIGKETLKKTRYYYVMKEYDGSTGNYIYKKLNSEDRRHLMMISKQLVWLQNGKKC